MTASPFFTIGHSNRSLTEFTELLIENAVEQVLDVRKLPGSTKYPHFNADVLEVALEGHGIELTRLEALTGRRPVSKDIPFEVNAWWENRCFHNYADHALSPEFRDGLAELREHGETRRVTLMCSEAVWWRCHRRIISDHLIAHGKEVIHVLGKNQIAPASLSNGAVIGKALEVTYPASH